MSFMTLSNSKNTQQCLRLQTKSHKIINFKKNNRMKSSNREIALLYLQKYAEKDLEGIEKMFSKDIVLRDWKIRVIGMESALAETKKNFEAVETLHIEVLSTYENQNAVAAELKITIDNKEELYVVDVITINPENKISAIRAYVGRGDDEWISKISNK